MAIGMSPERHSEFRKASPGGDPELASRLHRGFVRPDSRGSGKARTTIMSNTEPQMQNQAEPDMQNQAEPG